jgi:hypothetical protein
VEPGDHPLDIGVDHRRRSPKAIAAIAAAV